MTSAVAEKTQLDFTGVLGEIRARIARALSQSEQIQLQQGQLAVQAATTGEPVKFEDRLRVFATLENWRHELEELLELCKKETLKASTLLLEDFAASGMQRTTIEGRTIYARTDRFVNKSPDKTQAEMCELLRQHGLGYLVEEGYSSGRLKSWVIDKLDSEDGGLEQIPDKLREALKIGEVTRLVSMKA